MNVERFLTSSEILNPIPSVTEWPELTGDEGGGMAKP
jgi:hypothetical protein